MAKMDDARIEGDMKGVMGHCGIRDVGGKGSAWQWRDEGFPDCQRRGGASISRRCDSSTPARLPRNPTANTTQASDGIAQGTPRALVAFTCSGLWARDVAMRAHDE